MMLRLILSPFYLLKKSVDSLGSVLRWTLIFAIAILSAFTIYLAFYMLYVPAKLHVKPVNFLFKLVYTNDIIKTVRQVLMGTSCPGI